MKIIFLNYTQRPKKDFASDNLETVKSALEKLQKESEAVVTKLYQANAGAGAQGANNAGEQGSAGDDTIHVDPDDVKVDNN